MDYTTIVAAPASDPAGFKYLAPYTGSAIGQHWMVPINAPSSIRAKLSWGIASTPSRMRYAVRPKRSAPKAASRRSSTACGSTFDNGSNSTNAHPFANAAAL